ncbi:hypothetical protein DTO169C6_4540 [Paecilomyces variotii]|nr:hypothetical protein DTO169C6_4540 [Paecilomyces variotii]KAJ9361162.1 hypothetical protein DTO027B9_1011 [Paecilomyces variotii]
MASPPVPSYHISSFGRKLRNATFILPHTGQRLKGLVNLRKSGSSTDDGEDERTPLLPAGEAPIDRGGTTSRIYGNAYHLGERAYRFAISDAGKGVFKCSVAYLLGSLATFIPAIAAFLGHQDGKHVVATITVYFHPARSMGSMFKALICAFLAFLYAAFISLTSMCVAMFFEDTLDLLPLGHALVLIIFCGGGLGFIGWTKLRLGDPLVNVACSLASLAIITVLTKEGAVQKGDLSFAKIFQVLKMVIMGVIATMTVSFLIFPISARKQLRSNLVTMTDTLATMLGLITESFLRGSEEELQGAEFTNASGRNKKAYGMLDKLVKEAKLEHYVVGTEKEYRLEKRLVRWVQNTTQNMGGLRSAAALQFELLKQSRVTYGKHLLEGQSSPRIGSSPFGTPYHEHQPILSPSLHEGSEERQAITTPDMASQAILKSPEDIFELFITHLGPSMRSLAFTLKEILEELPFGPTPEHRVVVNSKFRISLDRALSLYRTSREEALKSVYKQKEIMRTRSLEVEADIEEVAASCGHFSFSLLDFGEQLKDLMAILDELQLEFEERPNGRSWNWLKFWRWRTGNSNDADAGLRISASGAKDISNMISIHRGKPKGAQSNSKADRLKERLAYRIWRSLSAFRRDDTKFAIKVGAGAALYALPSFLSATRPFYSYWRGEWGLLSYMLVCSMTIGASNTTGYARFLGTSLGAVCAIGSWYVTAGNVFFLAFLGWMMAMWTAYIILVKGQGPMGRFIMLTYNLCVLYAYSLSQDDSKGDQDEGGAHPVITEITLHRVVAVLSGCVWGIIFTRLLWPISARKKLKDGLSLLWLRMSVIWKRDPLSTMVQGKETAEYMNDREKLQVARFMSHLEGLQASARAEFELKSSFNDALYTSILRRTRSMVDAFHAMNLEIVKNRQASEGEIALLHYTMEERSQLTARISHLLSVLASSMKLEYPLSDVLPNIEHARDRLLSSIFHYRQDSRVSQLTTDEDYALLYAYALVTGQLCTQIMGIASESERDAVKGALVRLLLDRREDDDEHEMQPPSIDGFATTTISILAFVHSARETTVHPSAHLMCPSDPLFGFAQPVAS